MVTAFLLGLMGSVHCAGMCGPLVLMTPVVGNTQRSFVISRVVYHAGRISVYALIGAIFGVIGESMIFAGLQRWLSIIAGVLMLLVVIAAAPLKKQLTRMPIFIKSIFGKFLHQRTYESTFALGATNGLLPCGLVYLAATASIASGSLLNSVAYMACFGVGTLPMLLSISFVGNKVSALGLPALQKIVPIFTAAVALFLIVRGQPFVHAESGKPNCPMCRAADQSAGNTR